MNHLKGASTLGTPLCTELLLTIIIIMHASRFARGMRKTLLNDDA